MSSDSELQFPDVNYGPKNVERIKELTISEWSPFFGKDYWEVFIFSMSYAFAEKLAPAKSVPGTGTMPARVFRQETRHLMRSLAIAATGDISVIKNPRDYVKICEQYAYVGFDEIYKKIHQENTEDVPVENVLFNIINQIARERS